MRVAIYTRVSTDGQDAQNQLAQLRDFCVMQNWTVVKVYTDVASGGCADRKQFKAMFDDAARRRFNVVLFWSLDRFSRQGVLETLTYLQHLSASGVAYRSFTEPYLDSLGVFKDAIIGLLAVLARQERVRLSERTIAGLQRARAQGRIGGRRQSTDAEQVRGLVASGMSLAEVARRLGVSKTSIFRALRRP